jgi:hypothetical protein
MTRMPVEELRRLERDAACAIDGYSPDHDEQAVETYESLRSRAQTLNDTYAWLDPEKFASLLRTVASQRAIDALDARLGAVIDVNRSPFGLELLHAIWGWAVGVTAAMEARGHVSG